MTFIAQGKFETPTGSPTTTVDFYQFENDQDFELDPRYRMTDQSGSKGNLAVGVDTEAKSIESQVIVIGSDFAVLQGIQGKEGTLLVRDKQKTVKLLNVNRIRGLEPQGVTVVNNVITPASYNWIVCKVKFVIENAA